MALFTHAIEIYSADEASVQLFESLNLSEFRLSQAMEGFWDCDICVVLLMRLLLSRF